MRHALTRFILLFWPLAASSETQYEETPFLISGKPYLSENWRTGFDPSNVYGELPFQYHSANQCLSRGEASLQDLATADLIWDALPSAAAVEVCIFRVADRLRSRDGLVAWMAYQGWELEQIRRDPNTYLLELHQGPFWIMDFRWNIEENGPRYGGEVVRPNFLTSLRTASVRIVLDAQAGVVEVGYGNTHTWSK